MPVTGGDKRLGAAGAGAGAGAGDGDGDGQDSPAGVPDDQPAGIQSPFGSVVCPTSIR